MANEIRFGLLTLTREYSGSSLSACREARLNDEVGQGEEGESPILQNVHILINYRLNFDNLNY